MQGTWRRVSDPPLSDRRAEGRPTIPELMRETREIMRANGFETPGGFPDPRERSALLTDDVNAILAKLSLIHSEVSEATEAVRKGDHANFGEELADVVIRVMDLAEGLSVSLEREIVAKLEKNRARAYRHGGKLA